MLLAAPIGDDLWMMKRYTVALACFTVNLAIGLQYAFSVFVIPLQEAYGWSRSEIALGLTISISVLNATGLFLGYYIDAYGPRKLGLIGVFLLGSGFTLMVFQRTLIEYYVFYGLLVGLGSGILYMSNIAAITKSGFKKIGSALGFVIAGFGLSAGFFGPLISYVIDAYGLKQAFTMLGLIGFSLALPVLAFPNTSERYKVDYVGSLLKIFRDRRVYRLWFLMALTTSIGFAISSFLKPYAKEFLANEMLATLPITFFALGNSLGRFVSGVLSDIFNAEKVLVFTVIYHSLNAIALMILPPIFPYVIFISTFIAGLGHGSLFTIFPKLTTEVFGTSRISQVYGAILSSSILGSFLGSFVSNLVYDIIGTYIPAVVALSTIQVFVVFTIATRQGEQYS